MFKVTLYVNKRVIELTLAEPGTANWNLPMNENYFKIYKGTQNSIEFVIRNTDRKPINLAGKKLIISIIDRNSWITLLQKPLRILDAYSGSAVLDLNDFEISVWPIGYLTFSVMIQDVDGHQHMIYINQTEGGHGSFELIDGPTMAPAPSYECNTFVSSYWGWPINQYWFSTVFPGSARRNNFLGLHTALIYSKKFSGKIWALGSLENNAPDKDNDVWFQLPIRHTHHNLYPPAIQPPTSESVKIDRHYHISLHRYTGVTTISFEASLQWVRFMFLPDKGLPGLNDTPNYGIVSNPNDYMYTGNYSGEYIYEDTPGVDIRARRTGLIEKILFRN
jgi:hypothetical protein